MSSSRRPDRRARRWFWALVLTAIAAMSGLYTALRAHPGPATGLAVAGTSLALLFSTAQAARIMVVLDRARRASAADPYVAAEDRGAPRAAHSLRDRYLGLPAQQRGHRRSADRELGQQPR